MKSALALLFVTTAGFSTAFSQDRIYWGDQDGASNNDYIYSVVAEDLSAQVSVYSDFALNPSGLAYYQANPTYPLFYVSNRIFRNDLANNSDDIVVPSGQFSRGIAIDYVGKKIYWTNSSDGYIGRADLDGSNATEAFITGLSNPWDVEIDPVNQKIYWSETDYPNTNAFIQRANLTDGSNIETLVSNVNSLGIAVDPLRGKLFYSTFSAQPTVHSANLDGSDDVVVSGLTPSADIDVDVRTGTLYMIDYSSDFLAKADPDGSNKSSISVSGTFIVYADVTAPSVSSIARQSPSTINVGEGGTAKFRVTFSEPVLSVNASDFELTGTPTGTISVTPVSHNTIYDVVVTGISGTGTLDLNIASANDVIDFGGNPVDAAIGTEETFTVITAPAPTIASVDPMFGAEGTTVTITGTNFSTTPEENIVTFNGVAATVTASTATEITTTVPAGAATGPLQVSTLGLTATGTGDYSVCTPPPKPTITSDGGVLTSSSDTNNQWLRNGDEIAGATQKTYMPSESGTYIVRVSSDGCSTDSDPTTFVGVEETFAAGVTLYPNPSRSSVHIELSATERHARAELYTTTGVRKESIVLSTSNGTSSGDLNIEPYADGMYVVVITAGRRVIARKFQKR
jgi:hypothetical protein